jgi:hypothetical protein
VDCDVVEIAQAILHAFERQKELFTALRRLSAREEVGEELRRVAHLLRLDAKPVAASRIELGQLFVLLADLPEAPGQLFGGGGLERDVPTVANEVLLRSAPLPRLQPSGDLERQGTKPRRANRVLGACERRRALLGRG